MKKETHDTNFGKIDAVRFASIIRTIRVHLMVIMEKARYELAS